MVVVEAIRPLTDWQKAVLAGMILPQTRFACEHCAGGLKPVKMRGGRQYVHYDRDERRISVCTEVRP